jgi:hypothetical protein
MLIIALSVLQYTAYVYLFTYLPIYLFTYLPIYLFGILTVFSQYNYQKKKTNNNVQNIAQKINIEQHEPHQIGKKVNR